jgi:hypothetical protein
VLAGLPDLFQNPVLDFKNNTPDIMRIKDEVGLFALEVKGVPSQEGIVGLCGRREEPVKPSFAVCFKSFHIAGFIVAISTNLTSQQFNPDMVDSCQEKK